MKYTFEITIAGCAANCAHCYVDGGPGPIMPAKDYTLCLERLVPALDRLEGDIALNLGNETFCHPQVAELFRLTDRVCPQYFDRRGEDFPTTGVALLRHRDREGILKELERKGISELFFAVHGKEADHDRITGFSGRYRQLFETADFLISRGFRVAFSLMLTKALIPGLLEVLARIRRYPDAAVYPVVPLYCPTVRMRRYQQYRASAEEILMMCDILDHWDIYTSEIRRMCRECTQQAIQQSGISLAQEMGKAPQWAFFHIDRDLQFYYGNAGMHTRHLGNLRQMSSREIYDAIAPLGANYDFEAFYPAEAFQWLAARLPNLQTNELVYPSRPDCYYAWLDELAVRNLLI